MTESYIRKRTELTDYFDRTASKTWARLTSDAPVSRIRQTVREGREAMQSHLLSILPRDLSGLRVLDAGCGPGALSIKLAERGARVIAVDMSESLIEVAHFRTPKRLKPMIDYRVGDMLADYGDVDHTIAMDCLIHYTAQDVLTALSTLSARTRRGVVFTLAPQTFALTLMHRMGKLFPKHDRSPAIIPQNINRLMNDAKGLGANERSLHLHDRISRGFYISQAMEYR